MALKPFFLTQVDTKSSANGNVVLNTNGQSADPKVTVRALMFDFLLDCTAGDTIDFETFAQAMTIIAQYRDKSPMIESCNASLLDYWAGRTLKADSRTGLGDFAAFGVAAVDANNQIRLRLTIPLADPRRREAHDGCIPLAEIGQFNIHANLAAGVTGACSNMSVTMYALCSEEKEAFLGLRPKFSFQNLTGQVTQFDLGGLVLRSMDAYATDSAHLLASIIANGFQVYVGGEMVVDGTLLGTLEAANALEGEAFYGPFSAWSATLNELLATATCPFTGGGYTSSLATAARHARFFDITADVSAADMEIADKVKFQAISPSANINSIQVLVCGYYPQSSADITRRKAALGVPFIGDKPDVSDGSKAGDLGVNTRRKLPVKLVG